MLTRSLGGHPALYSAESIPGAWGGRDQGGVLSQTLVNGGSAAEGGCLASQWHGEDGAVNKVPSANGGTPARGTPGFP